MTQKKRNLENVLFARSGIRANNELIICEKGLFNTFSDCKFLLETPDEFWNVIYISGRERLAVKNSIRDILDVTIEIMGEWTLLAFDHSDMEEALFIRLKGFQEAEADYPELVEKTRSALKRRVNAGNKARDTLVSENRGLLNKIIKPYLGFSEDLIEELSSVCLEEMLTCIDRTFDPNRKLAFSTYATSCMKNKCAEAAGKWNTPYHVPNAKIKERNELVKGEKNLDGDVYPKLTLLNSTSYAYFEDMEPAELDASTAGEGGFDAMFSRVSWDKMVTEVLDKMVENWKDEEKKKKWQLSRRVLELRGIKDLGVAEEPARFEEIAQILYDEGLTDSPVTYESVRQYLRKAMDKFSEIWRESYSSDKISVEKTA